MNLLISTNCRYNSKSNRFAQQCDIFSRLARYKEVILSKQKCAKRGLFSSRFRQDYRRRETSRLRMDSRHTQWCISCNIKSEIENLSTWWKKKNLPN